MYFPDERARKVEKERKEDLGKKVLLFCSFAAPSGVSV